MAYKITSYLRFCQKNTNTDDTYDTDENNGGSSELCITSDNSIYMHA